MRSLVALAAVAAGLSMAVAPAAAHLVGERKADTLKATIAYQERQLSHAKYVCARGTGKPKAWHCQAARWIAKAAAVSQAQLLATLIPHRSLWLCIHDGEGAWDANTGNGYFGGLQMTWGWGILPEGEGGGAHAYSPEYQMRVAEIGYRQSGYSTAWLFGQWPNTAPPCV